MGKQQRIREARRAEVTETIEQPPMSEVTGWACDICGRFWTPIQPGVFGPITEGDPKCPHRVLYQAKVLMRTTA